MEGGEVLPIDLLLALLQMRMSHMIQWVRKTHMTQSSPPLLPLEEVVVVGEVWGV